MTQKTNEIIEQLKFPPETVTFRPADELRMTTTRKSFGKRPAKGV
jgi:hypothetical protein